MDTSGYAEALPVPEGNVDFGAPRVRLKWYTPDGDKLVAHIARVSNSKATLDDPASKLIKYLIRNRHWSPFEMVNLCLEIHTERDISAQILRHSEEFRFQEFSTRYAEVEDLRWSTECRFQDHKNRQNSFTASDQAEYIKNRIGQKIETGSGSGAVLLQKEAERIDQTVSYFDAVVNEARERSLEGYRELLERGVAKECARRILPIGLCPTVMYINSNLRGWIHYLQERTKPGVQKEHREIALAVEPIIAELFPMVWDAVIEDRAEHTLREWKIEQFDKIGSMFTEFFGSDWHNSYPNTSIAEAIRQNLHQFKPPRVGDVENARSEKLFVVYGPRASGKTHNAEAIAAHYKCGHIIDNFGGELASRGGGGASRGPGQVLPGTLLLVTAPEVSAYALRKVIIESNPEMRDVHMVIVHISDALEAIAPDNKETAK